MIGQFHRGNTATIRLYSNISLSFATSVAIVYRKPNGTRGQWAAHIDGLMIWYQCTVNDLDVEGAWQVQAVVSGNGQSYTSDVVAFTVLSNL